jgi:hypothetical protein
MLRINSATKNLLLTFLFLVKRIGKNAKQMLHFIQHDTTANCERSERYGCFFASFVSLRRSLS